MKLSQFLLLANAFADHGDAICAQMNAIACDGADIEDQNGDAMRVVARFFRRLERVGVEDAGDMAEEIEQYLNRDETLTRAE